MSLHDTETKDQFVELITLHRSAMFGYILALVQNNADAEDLLQQTCLVLWRKFDQYDPAGNFVHWANKIAQYEVQNFFRRKGRDHVVYGDSLIGDLAVAATDDTPERTEAMLGCLDQLKPADRELIEACYCDRTSVKQVAESRGRSADSVYKSNARIRRWLFECVERTLAQGRDRP